MNIIDAVKSGKRIRPLGTKDWYGGTCCIPHSQILCDWEAEERKIEITESQFDEVYSVVFGVSRATPLREELKKRLFERGG